MESFLMKIASFDIIFVANEFISPLKSFHTQQHCYVSLKASSLARFELGPSCSRGGCDVHWLSKNSFSKHTGFYKT
jgi:hypothetical protein